MSGEREPYQFRLIYQVFFRQIQIAAGFPDPLIDHMPWLRQVLKGIRVQAARIGRHPRPCLPITPSILRKLWKVWLEGIPTFNNAILWAASMTTFFSFCRSGEISNTVQYESKLDPQTYLCFLDVAVDNALDPSTISFTLKYSKTDQFRKGVKLVMGRTKLMTTFAQSQRCYHTYLIVAMFLALSSTGTTTHLYQSKNLSNMFIMHC